ncbi:MULTISPECIES: CU044_2847 family protein [unclassified Streptomyces]|uniref:CU044_2847 family protein n=1 Tax=unclassified Streptomyces TaxID=2593676 RepID=UPI0032511595
MGDVVRFALRDGGSILVEPVDDEAYGLEEISVSGNTVVRRAQQSLGAALDGIREMAAEAHARITALDVAPHRLELEFGVRLSGEAGAVLARTKGEAHLVVRAVWEKEG